MSRSKPIYSSWGAHSSSRDYYWDKSFWFLGFPLPINIFIALLELENNSITTKVVGLFFRLYVLLFTVLFWAQWVASSYRKYKKEWKKFVLYFGGKGGERLQRTADRLRLTLIVYSAFRGCFLIHAAVYMQGLVFLHSHMLLLMSLISPSVPAFDSSHVRVCVPNQLHRYLFSCSRQNCFPS